MTETERPARIRTPRWVWVISAAIVLAAALIAGAVLLTRKGDGEVFPLTGTITREFTGGNDLGIPPTDLGGCTDLEELPVLVLDEGGAKIAEASTSLIAAPGRADGTDIYSTCRVTFAVDVPRADLYEVKVAGRTIATKSFDELSAQEFEVAFTESYLPEPSGYSEAFRNSFMASCEASSGGQTGYCQCALDFLEANGPADENDISAQDQQAAIQACGDGFLGD